MRSFFVLSCLLALSLALPFEEFNTRILQGASDVPVTHESFKELALKALNTTELVFGGHFARPGLLPMQAFLIYTSSKGGTYQCGGTLISPNHILTAAHCAVDLIAPSRIMLGGVNYNTNTSNTQWREINGVAVHPNYDDADSKVFNDIAILQFKTPVSFNRDVKLTNLVSNDESLLKNSPYAIVSGFGTYKFQNKNESVTSTNLRYADVKIFSLPECRLLRPHSTLKETQICAGAEGRGVGGGDSGGPISVVKNHTIYQLGIASYAIADPDTMENHQDKKPSVFTRVSQFCSYIARVTRNAAKCKKI